MRMDIRIRHRRSAPEPILAEVYPDQDPFAFLTQPASPLRSVRVFTHPEGHLHYVGVGLCPRLGVELTFRLADDGGARPSWPVRLLEAFAEHAVKAGRPLGPGHYLCLREAVDPAGMVRCGALVRDPGLRACASVRWLQVVALAEDEVAMISEGYERWLEARVARAPHFVTG